MKISVALCTYNGEKFIREQLMSILNQSLLPDEIIICDDCSTDKTYSILQEFTDKHSFIKTYENKTNIGVIKNFEKALYLCSGDVIFLSDQDDVWLEHKVEFFIEYFERNKKTQLLFSNAELLVEGYEDKEIKAKTLFDLLDFKSKTQKAFKDGFGLEVMQILGRTSGFTMGIRKELVDEVLPFVPKYDYFIHDRQLSLYALEKNVIDFSTECLTKYRIHKNQTSNIYEYLLKNKLLARKDDKLLKFVPISNDVIDYLRIKGFENEKYKFSELRRRNIKSFIGVFLMLINLKSYKRIYKQYWAQALFYDISAFFSLNIKRIKSIIKQ